MSFKLGPISIGGKGGIAFQPGKMNLLDIANTASLFAPGGNLAQLGKGGLGSLLKNVGVNSIQDAISSPIAGALLGGLTGAGNANDPNSYGDGTLSTLIGLLGNEALDENARNSILRLINAKYRDQLISALDPANTPERRHAQESRALNSNIGDAYAQSAFLRSRGYGDSMDDGVVLGAHNRAMESMPAWDAAAREQAIGDMSRILDLTQPSHDIYNQLAGTLGANETLKSQRMGNYENAPMSSAEALQQILAHLGLIGQGQQQAAAPMSRGYAPAIRTAPKINYGISAPWESPSLGGPLRVASNKSLQTNLAGATPGAAARNSGLSLNSFGTGTSSAGMAAGLGTMGTLRLNGGAYFK